MSDWELQHMEFPLLFIVCTHNFQIIVKESAFVDQLCRIIAIFDASFKCSVVLGCVLMAHITTGANGYYPSLKSGQFQSSRVMIVCSWWDYYIINISHAWAAVFI